ncbi:MAG: preprotein translocase subunit SecF [Acidimicrobiales bacterium]|jgi:preprotein translocase subunit SecF|nr:preprotein translocase subunit SecF [Acidimicrobiales bacterium]
MTEPMHKKANIFHRLYHGETAFDFVGRAKVWFLLSALVIAAGVLSLVGQGLNYGIDFKGGTVWEVPISSTKGDLNVISDARSAMSPLGLGDAKIQVTRSGSKKTLRVAAKHQTPDKQTQITSKLADFGKVPVNQINKQDVGPSWGKAVTKKARTALIAFFIAVTIYISLRFEWKMAVAAIIAVVHDILVTVGVYSVSRFVVTPATVVAFLTILGYSLYDTVVVYDKIEENTRGLSASGRMTYGDTVNLSMNQVLMRSINTSLVAIMPILSILIIGSAILGAHALQDFGLALLVGLLTGAYSSIFVASPVLAMLKEREPRYATIRQRIISKGGAAGVPLTPAAAAVLAGGGSLAADGGPPLRPGMSGSRLDDTDGSDRARPQPSRPGGQAGAGKASAPRPGGNRPPPRPRKKKRR